MQTYSSAGCTVGAGILHLASTNLLLLPRPGLTSWQDLIQQLSRDVLDAAPGVTWDDIAGLGALVGAGQSAAIASSCRGVSIEARGHCQVPACWLAAGAVSPM